MFYRFKVEAKVIDSTGSRTFVLFDRVVSDFLGRTAQQILDDIPADNPLPADFSRFYNRDLLFKVSILRGNLTQNWQHFAVKRLTDDPAIIKSFIDNHTPSVCCVYLLQIIFACFRFYKFLIFQYLLWFLYFRMTYLRRMRTLLLLWLIYLILSHWYVSLLTRYANNGCF